MSISQAGFDLTYGSYIGNELIGAREEDEEGEGGEKINAWQHSLFVLILFFRRCKKFTRRL